jgi:hypothetical protein
VAHATGTAAAGAGFRPASPQPHGAARIIRINTEVRPVALQAALLVPLFAGLIGLFVSFRMGRPPDIAPSAAIEGVAFG